MTSFSVVINKHSVSVKLLTADYKHQKNVKYMLQISVVIERCVKGIEHIISTQYKLRDFLS
jgi:hypothetical protein